MNSKRILDALKQIPFQVMFLCLSGLIAIFVMIIPDYISKALMWFSEGMTAKLGVGSIIVTVIGIVASMVAMFEFMKKSGDDGALVAAQSEAGKDKFNVLYPIIIVVCSLALYTLVCFAVGFDYIAGAVKALAPLLAGFSANDVFSDISTKDRFIAYIIVTVPQIPMMFIGYIYGFKTRIKNIHAV